MNIYHLTGVKKMGEPHPDFGQTYWCEATESDLNLMFSSHKDFGPGQVITAEEATVRQGKKGDYLLLKKVGLVNNASETQKPATEPQNSSQGQSQSQLDRIEAKIDQLLETKKVAELVDSSEPLSLDDMPEDFLK